jgi:hypothetical protein
MGIVEVWTTDQSEERILVMHDGMSLDLCGHSQTNGRACPQKIDGYFHDPHEAISFLPASCNASLSV